MKSILQKGVVSIIGIICGGVVLCSAAVQAQEIQQTTSLGEMVVTATKTEKYIQDIPASISMVKAEDIAAKNVNSVTQALQMIPGVYMDQSAQGGLMIRGFSSTDILVLIDGQPVNSGYNNSMNWELVPVESIEKIELLRGAASSLYGGRAVGAVVNIITKENKKTFTANGVVSYGSNNTWKKALYADFRIIDKLSVGGGYENRSSDGYRGYFRATSGKDSGTGTYSADLPQLSDGSYVYGGRGEKDWENENYSFNLQYDLSDLKSIKYTFMRSENTYSYNNPFSYVYDDNGNQVFSGSVITQNGDYITLSPRYFLGYEGLRETNVHMFNYKDDNNKIVLNLGFTDTKRDGYSSPASATDVDWDGAGTDSFYPSETYNADLHKTWENFNQHTIITGLNIKLESFDQERKYLDSWKDHDSVNADYGLYEKHGGKAKNYALFVQDEYNFCAPWTVYLGLRYDYYKKYDGYSDYIEADGSYKRSVDHGEGDYSELSPKIALEFMPNEKMNYYASYGHSFNPPALYQIYRDGGGGMGSVTANPDLEPETSDTFEIGMKWKLFSQTNLGLALYFVKTEDKIVYTTHYSPGTTTKLYKKYENFGEEKRRGVEFEINHQFTDAFGGYINYAWQDGKILQDQIENTNLENSESRDYNIPKHLFHAGLSFKKDRWNILLDSQYVSERQEPDSVTGEYGAEDDFFVVNAALNFDIMKNTTLQLTADNLLDSEFYCSEATSGRTITVGLRYMY